MQFHFPSQQRNLHTLRRAPLSEISGSLGDLGTLLPLMVALAFTGSISLSATLVFTGLANIVTGAIYGVPLPVQPMKAIAAVAIARSFSPAQTASAGIFVAAVIGFLSVTGLLGWLGRVVPVPVIKGIQVGAGLSLVLAAGSSFFAPLGWTTPGPLDNLFWALGTFILLLCTVVTASRSDGFPVFPYALVVVIAGISIAILGHHYTLSDQTFQLWHPKVVQMTGQDFLDGALNAGIGQVPLTALNSIVAVTHLCHELLPDLEAPSEKSIGISIMLMNFVAVPFGAMPTCHGSGGLAGQYRFGARSGASVIILGLLKLILGLFISDVWLSATLQRFPKALLGVMVAVAGLELAKVGEGLNVGARDLWERADGSNLDGENGPKLLSDAERKDRWMVMTFTVAGLLIFKNTAVGFVVGLVYHYCLLIHRRYDFFTGWPIGQANPRVSAAERQGLLSAHPDSEN